MNTDPDLPRFEVIQAALRKTTEHLAHELHTRTPAAPQWSDFEWKIACATASLHGISALLANRLEWTGPPVWRRFLDDQLEHSRQRHQQIGDLLVRIDAAARARQVPVVALKGAALRALDLYAPGERPMGDVDLLVRPDDLSAAGAVLEACGYRLSYSLPRHAVFEPVTAGAVHDFGEHAGNGLKIDVHTRVSEALPLRSVEITASLLPRPLRPGLNSYGSIAALMRHLLLHAAGNMRAHALRHVQLTDIARLSARLQPDDWGELLGGGGGQEPWWMLPPLALVANYWPGTLPSGTLDYLRRGSPRQLQRLARKPSLTPVSWSNLRIHAFPGIGWSRTPLEAVRFAATRIWPRRDALDSLQFAVAVQPILRHVAWYELSHGRRILRWIYARPPRVQTLAAVHAALRPGA